MPIEGLDYLGSGITSADGVPTAAERRAASIEAAKAAAEKRAATAAAAAATKPLPLPAAPPPAPQTIQEMSVAPPIWTSVIPPGTTPIVKPTPTTAIMPLISPKPVATPTAATPQTATVIVSTKPIPADPITRLLTFIQNLFKKKSVPQYSKPGYKGGTISELERGR